MQINLSSFYQDNCEHIVKKVHGVKNSSRAKVCCSCSRDLKKYRGNKAYVTFEKINPWRQVAVKKGYICEKCLMKGVKLKQKQLLDHLNWLSKDIASTKKLLRSFKKINKKEILKKLPVLEQT